MSEFRLNQPAQAALVLQIMLNNMSVMGKADIDGLQDFIDNKEESTIGRTIIRNCSMEYPVFRTQPRAEFDVMRSFNRNNKDSVVIGEVGDSFHSFFFGSVEKMIPARKLKSGKFSETPKGPLNEVFAKLGGTEMAALWQVLKGRDRNGFLSKKNIFITTHGKHVTLEMSTTGWLVNLLPNPWMRCDIDPKTRIVSLA